MNRIRTVQSAALLFFCNAALFHALAPFKASAQDKGGIVDRAVMEIAGQTYTQRQLERYLLTKQLLNAKVPTFESFKDELAKHWPAYLQTAKKDLTILAESHRLNSFRPGQDALDHALETLHSRLNKDSRGAAWLAEVEVGEEGIKQNAALVLQVEVFKRSKERSAESSDSRKQDWYTEVERQTLFRMYEEGDRFQRLQAFRP